MSLRLLRVTMAAPLPKLASGVRCVVTVKSGMPSVRLIMRLVRPLEAMAMSKAFLSAALRKPSGSYVVTRIVSGAAASRMVRSVSAYQADVISGP